MIENTHLDHGASINSPELIIIHSMGEYVMLNKKYHHAVKFLDLEGLSAHALIAPDATNYRCRNDDEGAYHAKGFNKNSLGMEFLVPGEYYYASFLSRIASPYVSDEQYSEGVRQTVEWLNLHPIKKIVRHSDLDPERKRDPGKGFPFMDFLHDIGIAPSGNV